MQDNKTPQWLQDLQESSWELEFLISGGAIFTLVQASSFFAEVVQSLRITAWLPGTDLLLLGVLGIQVLAHHRLRAAPAAAGVLGGPGVRHVLVSGRRPARAGAVAAAVSGRPTG